MAGKRASYVNPIKLYIFIAFVFFLALSFLNKSEHVVSKAEQKQLDSLLAGPLKISDQAGDTVNLKNLGSVATYHSVEQYDSIQQVLPATQRDNWVQRKLAHLYFKGAKDGAQSISTYFSELLDHNIPKLMFILLPLFAWYVKLMYDKKRWFYADHAILSIHFHSFYFVLYLVCLSLDKLMHTEVFTDIGLLITFVYLVLALKNTYGQGFMKSFVKAAILAAVYGFTIALVFGGFLLVAGAIIV